MEIVENLKSGDVLHCYSNRLISKLIRKFTKSKFSHTALFLEVWGQPYVIDAQKDGVNLRPFEEWVKKYDYSFEATRNTKLSKKDIEALSKKALSKSGHTAYDFEGLLIKQPIELLTGKWRKKKTEDTKMYCSEFVAWVYGVEEFYKMSPEDFYEWCKNNNFTLAFSK